MNADLGEGRPEGQPTMRKAYHDEGRPGGHQTMSKAARKNVDKEEGRSGGRQPTRR